MSDVEKRGLFVTFEGIDGSGKSTQANSLLRRIQENGNKAVLFREPGGTAISEQIRQILLNTQHLEMSPITEVLLYSAARAQLTEQMVIPGLLENDVVICDRYFDSTIAYQGYGRGINIEFINALIKEAVLHLWPDITFLVDVDVELAEKRSGTMRNLDRMEVEDTEFKKRVINGFRDIAEDNKERVIILDGNKDVEDLTDQSWNYILKLLEARGKIEQTEISKENA